MTARSRRKHDLTGLGAFALVVTLHALFLLRSPRAWSVALAVGVLGLLFGMGAVPGGARAAGWVCVASGIALGLSACAGPLPTVVFWAGVLHLFRSSASVTRRKVVFLMTAGAVNAVFVIARPDVGQRPDVLLVSFEIAAAGWVVYHAGIAPFLALANSSRLARQVVGRMERQSPSAYEITPSRERILERMCASPHMTNRDIAKLLHLSSRTVERYVSELIAATGVDNRRHLVTMFEYHYLSRGLEGGDAKDVFGSGVGTDSRPVEAQGPRVWPAASQTGFGGTRDLQHSRVLRSGPSERRCD